MNQNRNQNRRRGRGGNRGQGGGGQGNRIDSRARGNAPQLLEKYKKLAHDASLNGDRVQTEYYLQFADHYFRVIADSRTQREDQRPRRDDRDDREDRDEREAAFDETGETEETEEPRRARRSREEGSFSAEGEPGAEGEEVDAEERNPFVRQGRGQQARGRGRNRPANGSAGNDAGGEEGGFDAAVLPPSISREDETPPRQPRGRGRRSRPTDDDGGEETLEAVG